MAQINDGGLKISWEIENLCDDTKTRKTLKQGHTTSTTPPPCGVSIMHEEHPVKLVEVKGQTNDEKLQGGQWNNCVVLKCEFNEGVE